MRRALALLALLCVMPAARAAAAPCVDGRAAGFECQRVDLLAHLDLATLDFGALNDVWGWTDPVTAREYALVGAVTGTVFVDITDPENPVIVGRLRAHDELTPVRCKTAAPVGGPRPLHDGGEDGGGGCEGGSAWRNIKTHADHAYIGSEAAGHGLQVFDLRQLRDVQPEDMPADFDETAHYGGFGNSHTLIVNEQTGFLYAVGSNTFAGGPHFVNLANPANPVGAGGWNDDGYTHEALCVTYAGPDTRYTGREVCLLSNEDALTVADVTDKGAVDEISRTEYAQTGYTHQGWLSADQRYFFVNDELDELHFGLRTRTLVWDLADLQDPHLVDQYLHPMYVIDHNNYVHQGFVYQSNYTAGLFVLDGRDPLNLFEVGFFDTHPADDERQFDGTWSNYPFFASGVVAVSDITGGLFLLRPRLPSAGQATDVGVELEWLTAVPDANRRMRLRVAVRNLGAVDAPETALSLSTEIVHAVEGFTVTSGGPAFQCEMTVDPSRTGPAIPRCRIASLAAGASVSVEFDILVANVQAAQGSIDAVGIVGSGALDTNAANNNIRGGIEWGEVPDDGDNGGGGAECGLLPVLAFLVARRRRRAPAEPGA